MSVNTSDRTVGPGDEDLAALLKRVLREADVTQRVLSEKSGVPISTISSWMTRRRGTTGRTDSDKLRAVAEALTGFTTVAEVFEAAGRWVPGELSQEREEKLLKSFRAMTPQAQRTLLELAEQLAMTPRVPQAK